MGSSFKGPLVLYGMTKVDQPNFTADLDPSDFTLALNGLAEYIKNQREGFMMSSEPKVVKKVKGVKMITDGTFEDVKIPLAHPIFISGATSNISKTFGPALLTWQPKNPKDETAGLTHVNETIPLTAYLHLNIEVATVTNTPGETKFGSLPAEWCDSTNAVMIARVDKGDTTATNVEMACSFCRDAVEPLLKDQLSKEGEPAVPTSSFMRGEWAGFVEKWSEGVK